MRASLVLGFAAVALIAACGGGEGGHGGSASSGAGGATTSTTSGATTSDTASGTGGSGGSGPTFTADSVKLCELVNAYRQEQGLPAVPLSVALMTVAADHVGDMALHPEAATGTCNLHSWSTGSTVWKGCCFTADFAQAACMWTKPSEITSTWGPHAYTAYGYEDAAAGVTDPEAALALWKADPPHDDVIVNHGIWAQKAPWPAMGCAMQGGFASLWFGDAADTQTFVP
jgi:hypothetical protein